MSLRRIRFSLWRLMVVIAIVGCAIGAGVAFSSDPSTATNMITGWAALYGVPVLVIVARGVPAGKVVKIVGKVGLIGVPLAGLFGLLCFGMSGYVGLIGGFTLAALVIGWWTLLGVGVFVRFSGVERVRIVGPGPLDSDRGANAVYSRLRVRESNNR